MTSPSWEKKNASLLVCHFGTITTDARFKESGILQNIEIYLAVIGVISNLLVCKGCSFIYKTSCHFFFIVDVSSIASSESEQQWSPCSTFVIFIQKARPTSAATVMPWTGCVKEASEFFGLSRETIIIAEWTYCCCFYLQRTNLRDRYIKNLDESNNPAMLNITGNKWDFLFCKLGKLSL